MYSWLVMKNANTDSQQRLLFIWLAMGLRAIWSASTPDIIHNELCDSVLAEEDCEALWKPMMKPHFY